MLNNEVKIVVSMIVLSIVLLTVPSTIADTKIFVKLGSDASFMCPFLASKDELIWLGPQHLSLYTTNENVNQARPQFKRIKVNGNFTAGEYIMIIENFGYADEGLYACDTIKDGKGVQHFISALVADKPSVIRSQRKLIFKTKLMSRTIISLLVKSYEKPEVTWVAMFGGGKRGYWAINPVTATLFNASSIIVPELQSHFGSYGLKVRNSAGSIAINIKLITSIMHLSQTNVICNASDAVNLTCYLNSNPINLSVRNEWIHTYHGVILRTFQGNTQGNRSTLSINFCVNKDTGNYTCKWIVDSQQYSANASVTVHSYPLLLNKRITSLNGYLLLEVIFYSKPEPNNITWYHYNNNLNENEKYQSTLNVVTTEMSWYGKTINTSAYLAVLSLSTSNQGLHKLENGVYSCHIKNLFGFIEESFNEKDIANVSVLKKQGRQNILSDKHDIHKIILATISIACSIVVIILFTSIGIIIHKARKIQIYHTRDLNEENNAAQDVTNLGQNQGTSSDDYLDVTINEYEEIESIPTPSEEQESIRLSSESSDDSEVLPKIVSTAILPINDYEHLQSSELEMHTYD